MYSYFLSLILLSSISFGGHFARSSLSIFGLYMINDSFITPGGFGILLGACALPSMLVPLIVGHAVDKSSQESRVTLALFFSETFGFTLLAVAVACRSYALALIAVMAFGMGTSSLSVIQRVLVTVYLKENVSFTTGFYVAMANISKMLGKLFVGPVVVLLGSYQVAMFFPATACMYSLAMYWAFHLGHKRGTDTPSDSAAAPRDIAAEHQRDLELAVLELEESPLALEALEHTHLVGGSGGAPPAYHSFPPVQGDPLLDTSIPGPPERHEGLNSDWSKRWLPESVRALPEAFFWLAGVHTLYILIFHSFVNFMPHLVYTAYHVSQQEAGYIACMPFVVTIFVAPPVGYLVDCVGKRVLFCAVAAALTVIAYTVVIYTNANPYLKMALVAVPHGFVPVLTLAEITSVLPPTSAGIAFGMIEVFDSIVNVLGSIVFGQLYNITGGYEVGLVLLLALAWMGMFLLIYMSIRGIPAPVL